MCWYFFIGKKWLLLKSLIYVFGTKNNAHAGCLTKPVYNKCMPKSKKVRGPFKDIRAIPLSPKSVESGFRDVFDEANPANTFKKALLKLKKEREVYGFLSSLTLRSITAKLMPEWEPTGRIASANELLTIGGAAIYLSCVKHEAKNKKISPPRVTLTDRTYYIGRLMPSEGVGDQFGSKQHVEEFAITMLKQATDSVTTFELLETEFCSSVFEFTPELGYDNVARHDIILGVANLHGLLDAHIVDHF